MSFLSLTYYLASFTDELIYGGRNCSSSLLDSSSFLSSEKNIFLLSSALFILLPSLSIFLAISFAFLAYLRDFLLPVDEPNPATDLFLFGDAEEVKLVSIGALIK